MYELARSPDFASLPVIPEDQVKDLGAKYSCEFFLFSSQASSYSRALSSNYIGIFV